MRTFQLDECFDSRSLADRCNAEAAGHAQVYRYPKRLKGTLDPEVLADLLPRGNPIVTIDRALPEEHTGCIHEPFPGIIVVCHSPAECRTMTLPRAAAILARVKDGVPNWPALPLTNSIVYATEAGVEVCRIEAGVVVSGTPLSYDDADWPTRVVADLQANAARSALPPGS